MTRHRTRRTREDREQAARVTRENVEAIERINRMRTEAGVCRHCGGPVPCWSPFGDSAVGVQATQAAGSRKRRR